MPSAANVKIDKQVNQETALAESSQNLTPLRQAITIIEHKIRNLEKRKTKLESYRELQNAGKELNTDQKTAVAKFNEVVNTLDFARELCKQFLGIASTSEKEAKKLAKKEAAMKYQAELARLREILLVQDALNQMGNESVRDDFLNGRNGAAQLTEGDLKLLDDFYPAVTPKHEAGNPTTFTNEVQAAAEHLLAAVDGKPKDVFGGTYSQIKEILGKIHESGYFDQAQVYENYTEEVLVETEVILDPSVAGSEVVASVVNHQQPTASSDTPVIESITIEARNVPGVNACEPTPAAAPAPSVQAQTAVQQQVSLDVIQPVAGMPPTATSAAPLQPSAAPGSVLPPEQIYYQPVAQAVSQPQVPQPAVPSAPSVQPPPRPITEMLGTGSFFFLQDSEIDPLPDQIPSQTFTNQTFATTGVTPAVVAPVVPTQQQAVPVSTVPPQQVTGATISAPQPTHYSAPSMAPAAVPQQPQPVLNHQAMQPVPLHLQHPQPTMAGTTNNLDNGLSQVTGGHHLSAQQQSTAPLKERVTNITHQQQQYQQKQAMGGSHNYPPQQQNRQPSHQAYYQDNGYSRQRQQQPRPRPANTRH